ncbi:ACN9-domain-containing protein [Apiospora aurea]|uniref:Succinate dehydrogenase assembly factor 3 n=1 Tax=Apiospora aurea TaxID=335848 RepID=A0ABR1QFY2_9PEZI
MRPSIRTLAQAASAPGGANAANALRPAPMMALLPPIPLYRRLLRAHRHHLPPEMRVLGDEYIKAEFRAHRNVDNPAHMIGFLTEWQLYAQKVEGDAWKGEKIDPAKVEKMSDQQIGQMYELMMAIKKQSESDDGQ